MNVLEVITILESKSNPRNVEGMKRFGIRGEKILGISVIDLRKLAKTIGENHNLAVDLWKTGIHEARMVAALIERPRNLTEKQVEKWVGEVDSWDICDMLAGSLFDKSELVIKRIPMWAKDEREYVKRMPFSMMAWIAYHNKNLTNQDFEKYFRLIRKASLDERNFVKKAVNWALRGIGKRNIALRQRAIEVAEEIKRLDSRSAKWIANDTIRELSSTKTVEMIKNRKIKL